MTSWEYLLRIATQLRPMVPGLAAAAIVTFAAVVSLYLLTRGSWMTQKRFWLVSLVFGLGTRGTLRLACIWLKLVFVTLFVVMFQSLTSIHYIMVLFPGFLAAVLDVSFFRWVENLFWLVLQIIGLLASNLVCRFVLDMAGGLGFVLVYVAMGVFVVLFSVYLFWNELSGLSLDRKIDPREIWAAEEEPLTEET